MVDAIKSTAASTIDADIKKLTPVFTKAIGTIIDAESGPLTKAKAARDAVDVRSAVFTDLKTNLDALQAAVKALISTDDTFGMTYTTKSSVTPVVSGTTVFSATSTDSAATGEYDIHVDTLALAHSMNTAFTATSPDVALDKSGTFLLGGGGVSASYTLAIPSTSLTAAATAAVDDGQRELGTGAYSLQVRDYAGTRQFRLVDADGNAVTINNKAGTSTTSDWQSMLSGEFDTGRGLSLTLDAKGATGSTALSYTAKGVSITIETTDTMRTIAEKINAATQPEGRDIKASIVANQLVLTGAQTGARHDMLFTDNAGLGLTLLQSARNASFTVNGMTIERASNSGLTDVIDGVTLNLAPDAEEKTAHLSVSSNSDKAKTAMNTLVSKFNDAFTLLTNKMAITSKTDGEKTTYTRNALTGDTVFGNLRAQMFSRMNRSYANDGSLKRLEEIGLTMDKDMKLSIDSTKFLAAFKANPTDVGALLDTAMGQFDTVLSEYAGSKGVIKRTLDSIDENKKILDQRIEKHNATLVNRKQTLYKQYLQMQIQLAEIGYQAQMFGVDLSK